MYTYIYSYKLRECIFFLYSLLILFVYLFALFFLNSDAPALLTVVPVLIRKKYFKDQLKRFDFLAQRKEIAEYNALKALTRIVPLYVFTVHFLLFITLLIYSHSNSTAIALMEEKNQTTVWFAFFTSVSAFHNTGLSTFSGNFVDFTFQGFVLFVIGMKR